MKTGLDERIDEGVLLWLGHVEKKEKDMIAKRVYSLQESVLVVVQRVGRGKDRLMP